MINAATGALAFVAAPDFEAPKDVGENNIYNVEIQVSDGSLTDTQSIAVIVANRNEAPKITSNGGQASAAISVEENVAAITTVTGSDPDASAKLTFAIVGGADADRFAIDATTGALNFVNAANFEMPTDANLDNGYQVTVEVSDGLLAARQTLLVAVTDVAGKSISGSKSRDTLRAAEGGESTVRGGKNKDVLLGTDWDEHLDGGKGKDKLFGGNGRDTLDGGRHKDLLVGGPHADSFRFTTKLGKGNIDKIKDFSPYYDRIELDIEVFPTMKVGFLAATAFHVGSKAADADDRIIYNLNSGALFYDRDGDGPARKIKFAVLADKPEKLHDGDFLVI
jgi:Ca2+-binding RTX toxin-like protein